MRFNLIYPEAFKKQMDELELKTGATTWAEVLRRAVTIYAALKSYKREDCEIVVRSKDGKERLLLIV